MHLPSFIPYHSIQNTLVQSIELKGNSGGTGKSCQNSPSTLVLAIKYGKLRVLALQVPCIVQLLTIWSKSKCEWAGFVQLGWFNEVKLFGLYKICPSEVINRPGVAGAVLQSPLSIQ